MSRLVVTWRVRGVPVGWGCRTRWASAVTASAPCAGGPSLSWNEPSVNRLPSAAKSPSSVAKAYSAIRLAISAYELSVMDLTLGGRPGDNREVFAWILEKSSRNQKPKAGVAVPDALSSVLDILDVRVASSARLEAAGHWGLSFPEPGQLKIIVALAGQCWVTVGRAEPVQLRARHCLLLAGPQHFFVLSA